MRPRHRIPTLFNIYMIDVLCCALGCVILLWLVNFREAERRKKASSEVAIELASARAELEAARAEASVLLQRLGNTDESARRLAAERDAARVELARQVEERVALDAGLADLRQRLAAAAEERDRFKGEVTLAVDRIAALDKERNQLKVEIGAALDKIGVLDARIAEGESKALALGRQLGRKAEDAQALSRELDESRKKLEAAQALLAEKQSELRALLDRSSEAGKQAADLQAKLREEQASVVQARKSADELAAQLSAAREQVQKLQGMAAVVPAQYTELQSFRGKLIQAEARVETLEKDLAAEKSRAERASQVAEAAEKRFAGVTLTGRRVIFLIDKSGSMDYLDPKTRDPNKWREVGETLGKVARSLPDLEKFQVIIFADQPAFIMGKDYQWLDFNRDTSVDQMVAALATVRPHGPTNMHAALQAAFRFRNEGLDTIYLFSDGLPNVGEGLDKEAARTLKETERAEVLGNHVRAMLKTSWNRELPGKPRVRVNALGFFYESPDVGAFLWALTRENEGSFVGMNRP